MFSKILGEIDAVAFDIDGTLYREINLNFRLIPHFLSHIIFFSKYGLVRKQLRKIENYSNLKETQIELMSKALHCSKEKAKFKLDKIVYTGLKKYFSRFNACSGAFDLIKRLKENGVKIAVLSDFPPEQKGDIWGISPYCDVVIGSEDIGALKPSAKVFTTLSEKLKTPVNKILYVGNHHSYDVVGSKNAGMKSAWIITPVKALFGVKSKVADVTFSKYHQLEKILFE